MCKCTPEIRTPFCGKPGCEWPESKSYEPEPIIPRIEFARDAWICKHAIAPTWLILSPFNWQQLRNEVSERTGQIFESYGASYSGMRICLRQESRLGNDDILEVA